MRFGDRWTAGHRLIGLLYGASCISAQQSHGRSADRAPGIARRPRRQLSEHTPRVVRAAKLLLTLGGDKQQPRILAAADSVDGLLKGTRVVGLADVIERLSVGEASGCEDRRGEDQCSTCHDIANSIVKPSRGLERRASSALSTLQVGHPRSAEAFALPVANAKSFALDETILRGAPYVLEVAR